MGWDLDLHNLRLKQAELERRIAALEAASAPAADKARTPERTEPEKGRVR